MRADDLDLDAADPVLSEMRLLALVRRHISSARSVQGIDESGRKGRAYFVDDNIVLKTQRPRRLRSRVVEEFETSLEKEAFFLKIHRRDPAILTPRFLGYGREADVEYVCMTRMTGVASRRANLSEPEREHVLWQLGAMLRRIHGLPLKPIEESGLFPIDGSPADLRAKLTGLLTRMAAEAEDLPDEWRLSVSAREVSERALAALPDAPERAALHSNPAPEHVFVDPDSGQLCGLIDFGDAYISHPALDLRPYRGPGDRAALLAGYLADQGVEDTFLATWRVGLVLGELAGALRRRQSPREIDTNLHQLLDEIP